LTPLGGISSPQQLNSGSSDSSGNFDWNSEENVVKWKGTFVLPLQKILNQVSFDKERGEGIYVTSKKFLRLSFF
jgi:hypothetical protein